MTEKDLEYNKVVTLYTKDGITLRKYRNVEIDHIDKNIYSIYKKGIEKRVRIAKIDKGDESILVIELEEDVI